MLCAVCMYVFYSNHGINESHRWNVFDISVNNNNIMLNLKYCDLLITLLGKLYILCLACEWEEKKRDLFEIFITIHISKISNGFPFSVFHDCHHPIHKNVLHFHFWRPLLYILISNVLFMVKKPLTSHISHSPSHFITLLQNLISLFSHHLTERIHISHSSVPHHSSPH